MSEPSAALTLAVTPALQVPSSLMDGINNRVKYCIVFDCHPIIFLHVSLSDFEQSRPCGVLIRVQLCSKCKDWPCVSLQARSKLALCSLRRTRSAVQGDCHGEASSHNTRNLPQPSQLQGLFPFRLSPSAAPNRGRSSALLLDRQDTKSKFSTTEKRYAIEKQKDCGRISTTAPVSPAVPTGNSPNQ